MPRRRARRNPYAYAIDSEKLSPTIQDVVSQIITSHKIVFCRRMGDGEFEQIPDALHKKIVREIGNNGAQALIGEADDEIIT